MFYNKFGFVFLIFGGNGPQLQELRASGAQRLGASELQKVHELKAKPTSEAKTGIESETKTKTNNETKTGIGTYMPAPEALSS